MKKQSYDVAVSIIILLIEEGYIAYIAGGWVRDYLLGLRSDEIDIATDASPETITNLFPKTVTVGIAFGVVLVMHEGYTFEISTFRSDENYKDGRHPQKIIFSSPQEDALRRDFTINGMFYDPINQTIYDYVGGKKDLKKGIIRAIGDPNIRFEEDRLRMIRAVRFSAKLGYPIEKKTEKAIIRHANTLFPAVSMERIWQEFCKMSESASFGKALLELHHLGLLQIIFPRLRRTSLQEIEKRVVPFSEFPSQCPTILFIMRLFPNDNLSNYLALCRYLKTSLNEAKLVEFFYKADLLFLKGFKNIEFAELAHFYAHPQSLLYLGVQKAYISSAKRTSFEKEHLKSRNMLALHIERIQKRTPLISASNLLTNGISPGKKMGLLLKEAERIAINHNLSRPEDVLSLLKQTPLWTQM